MRKSYSSVTAFAKAKRRTPHVVILGLALSLIPAAANANQRMGATQASMSGAASLRGQDIGLNTTNANILSPFSSQYFLSIS
jgi:hypothetical protein